jgi:hypothetical protein
MYASMYASIDVCIDGDFSVFTCSQSRKVQGTTAGSQAATALHLGDVLFKVNDATVQQWRAEDFAKVNESLRGLHKPRRAGYFIHLLPSAGDACVNIYVLQVEAQCPTDAAFIIIVTSFSAAPSARDQLVGRASHTHNAAVFADHTRR